MLNVRQPKGLGLYVIYSIILLFGEQKPNGHTTNVIGTLGNKMYHAVLLPW